jgi:hypothetical protein
MKKATKYIEKKPGLYKLNLTSYTGNIKKLAYSLCSAIQYEHICSLDSCHQQQSQKFSAQFSLESLSLARKLEIYGTAEF